MVILGLNHHYTSPFYLFFLLINHIDLGCSLNNVVLHTYLVFFICSCYCCHFVCGVVVLLPTLWHVWWYFHAHDLLYGWLIEDQTEKFREALCNPFKGDMIVISDWICLMYVLLVCFLVSFYLFILNDLWLFHVSHVNKTTLMVVDALTIYHLLHPTLKSGRIVFHLLLVLYL